MCMEETLLHVHFGLNLGQSLALHGLRAGARKMNLTREIAEK